MRASSRVTLFHDLHDLNTVSAAATASSSRGGLLAQVQYKTYANSRQAADLTMCLCRN